MLKKTFCSTASPIGRADPMIAATAIIHGLVLVTGNEEHYQRVGDAGYALILNNWKTTTQSP